ncbi:MAG TPA: cobalamin biosynthesis protein, partial [Caldilineaceae bacterium]|nr:cobalamin biosynthesis protein [Caldilineaceae bacterium]
WLGKAGARADDLANWLPARLAALLLVAAAGKQAGRAWRTWRRDRGLTASPNAGQPMSAMAGALGVALEKVGHYTLGAEFDKPTVAHVDQAAALMRRAVWLGVLLAGGAAANQRLQRVNRKEGMKDDEPYNQESWTYSLDGGRSGGVDGAAGGLYGGRAGLYRSRGRGQGNS